MQDRAARPILCSGWRLLVPYYAQELLGRLHCYRLLGECSAGSLGRFDHSVLPFVEPEVGGLERYLFVVGIFSL